MAVLLKNNAVSKLAGSIDTTQTTISVTSGEGDKFPSPSGGDWFPLTLEAISGGAVTREVVRCTARSGDTLTVARGQEGTSGQAFAAGDRVEIRFTSAVFDLLAQLTGNTGSLMLPVGTTAQRDASPGSGYARFNSDTGFYEAWTGSAWWPFAHITGGNGSLLIPSGTTAERDASPGSNKLLRFNTDTGLYEGYNGSEWVPVGSGATGGGGDQVFVQNDQVVNNDYTIPGNKNAMSTGPITISDGVNVTVDDGARWVII